MNVVVELPLQLHVPTNGSPVAPPSEAPLPLLLLLHAVARRRRGSRVEKERMPTLIARCAAGHVIAEPVRSPAPLFLLPAVAAMPACAHDTVLQDTTQEAVCGDGIVESGEACDTKSAGCYACGVVPGWTCAGSACSPICGDGVVGTGASCDGAHRDTACDLTGFWAVRETDYERDMVLQNVQTSTNWYLYEIAQQTGDAFDIVASMDCGVHVSGSVTVDYAPASLRAMLHANPEDGTGTHGVRHGKSVAAAGGCAVSLDRWYFTRALDASFLPADFSTAPDLSSLPPIPGVSDPVNGVDDPPGVTDPDGDGFRGLAFAVTGFVSGIRDEAQRIWKQYADLPGAPSPANALTFAVPGALDVQLQVLHVGQCGTACALLKAGAVVATDIQPRATFSFIGRTLGGARTATVVVNRPGANPDDDLTTCANVRLMLPHDPSLPPGQGASSSNGP